MVSRKHLKLFLIIALIFRVITTFCHDASIIEITKSGNFNTFTNYDRNQYYLDSSFINAALIVLKRYPELENIKIKYIKKNINTMMAARPVIGSTLKQMGKRKYKIITSTNPKNKSEKLFRQISINAYEGILSHEFAHILCYSKKTGVQLIFYSIAYPFKKRKIERETDQIAIDRGFGKELIEYNQFIITSNLVSKKYLKNKERNYLSIKEIEKIIYK